MNKKMMKKQTITEPHYYQAIGFFISPVPMTALAILILNDHWLKYRFPGFITGILSDFCGIFVTPLFLVAAIITIKRIKGLTYSIRDCRRWILISIIAVDAGFILIKTSADFAKIYVELLTPILGSTIIVRDLWDLLALLVNPLSYWFVADSFPRNEPE